MKLAKLHGLGNDFLVVRTDQVGGEPEPLGALAGRICRRRTGIGADGAVFYQLTVGDGEADVSALIYNADGSRAEMSGNGLRCLAAYLIHAGILRGRALRIRTVSGIRAFTLVDRKGRDYVFECSMGLPITDPAAMRVSLPGTGERLVDVPLPAGEGILRVTITSMGNPHCTTFWPDLQQVPVERLGPLLERMKCFPERTNVEFVEVLNRHRIRVRFWERGVGATPASGTGGSAAAVAAILNGFAASPVTVEAELGNLMVRWEPPEELRLTGPAQFICSCDWEDGTSE